MVLTPEDLNRIEKIVKDAVDLAEDRLREEIKSTVMELHGEVKSSLDSVKAERVEINTIANELREEIKTSAENTAGRIIKEIQVKR